LGEMVAAYVASGRSTDFFVWCEGKPNWAAAGTLAEVQAQLNEASPARPASGIVRPPAGIVRPPAGIVPAPNDPLPDPPVKQKPRAPDKAQPAMPMYNFDAIKPAKQVPPPLPVLVVLAVAAIATFVHGHLPKLKGADKTIREFVAECTQNSRKVDLTGQSFARLKIASTGTRYRVERIGAKGSELFVHDGSIRTVYFKPPRSQGFKQSAPGTKSALVNPESHWIRRTSGPGAAAESVAGRATNKVEKVSRKGPSTVRLTEWFDRETGIVLKRTLIEGTKDKTNRDDIFECKSAFFGPVNLADVLGPGEQNPELGQNKGQSGQSVFGNPVVWEAGAAIAVILVVVVIARMQEKPFGVWILGTLFLQYVAFIYLDYMYLRVIAGGLGAIVLMMLFEKRRATVF